MQQQHIGIVSVALLLCLDEHRNSRNDILFTFKTEIMSKFVTNFRLKKKIKKLFLPFATTILLPFLLLHSSKLKKVTN